MLNEKILKAVGTFAVCKINGWKMRISVWIEFSNQKEVKKWKP
jgi:hypothetical protein